MLEAPIPNRMLKVSEKQLRRAQSDGSALYRIFPGKVSESMLTADKVRQKRQEQGKPCGCGLTSEDLG